MNPYITSVAPLSVNEVRLQINKLLDQHFEARRDQAATISPDYERLWRTIADSAADGKRLRPYLVYLGYSVCGGDEPQLALYVGMAIELLHLCMLAHDDIIDRDFIRHGKPNIAGTYVKHYSGLVIDDTEVEHFANGAALLAGDLLMSEAHQTFMSARLPEENRDRLNRLFDMAIFTVAGGELMDCEAPMRPIYQVDSLKVAEYKTAYYSCSIPLAIGAVMAGADQDTEDQYMSFGRDLGIAYQLSDDLLGTFGDEDKTGKSNMSDLREAKRTYLLRQAYRMTDDQGRRNIDRILRDGRHDDAQLNIIKQIMTDSGAKAATIALKDRYIRQALQTSASLRNTNPSASRLDDFVNLIVNRAD